MTLTTEQRINLAEKLRPVFLQHGRDVRVEHVPFFLDLNPEQQEAVKKILKKFRSGSHTPDTLLEEYQRWKDGAGSPSTGMPKPPIQPTQKTFIKSVNRAASQSLKQAHKNIPQDLQREQAKADKREKKAAQKRQKNALEIALIAALRENREFSDYKDVFFAARGKQRKIIAFLPRAAKNTSL